MNLDSHEQLIIHIEGLQATLTKRNARIAELEQQYAKANKNILLDKAVKKAYKQGWQACAARLMEITRTTALELSEIRQEAWRAYSEGENK